MNSLTLDGALDYQIKLARRKIYEELSLDRKPKKDIKENCHAWSQGLNLLINKRFVTNKQEVKNAKRQGTSHFWYVKVCQMLSFEN